MISTATNRRTFIERAAPSSAVRVDHEAGIIRGAKLVGITSDNGRRYPVEVLRAARHLYKGARVNVDHPTSARKLERSFSDWAGVVENVQVRDSGLFGDLRLRKSGAAYAALMEAAAQFPNAFGLSHVAFGDGKMINSVEVVQTIDEVASVDVVLEPATTRGLFESRQRRDFAHELIESRARRAELRARIAELEAEQSELADVEFTFAAKVERARRKLGR